MSKNTIQPGSYRHDKSGKIYTVLNERVINATNGSQDGWLMVLYFADATPEQMFVREISQFNNRFTRLP